METWAILQDRKTDQIQRRQTNSNELSAKFYLSTLLFIAVGFLNGVQLHADSLPSTTDLLSGEEETEGTFHESTPPAIPNRPTSYQNLEESSSGYDEAGQSTSDSDTSVRADSSNFWTFGVGPRNAWQSVQFSFFWMTDFDTAVGADFGGGRWTLLKQDSQKDYSFSAHTYSASLSMRKFILGDSGVYLSGGLAVLEFSGKISPKGASADPEAQLFDTSFEALAVAPYFLLGWQFNPWDSFFFDWQIIGMERNVLLSKSFGGASSELTSALESELEENKVWGVLNLAIGYYF